MAQSVKHLTSVQVMISWSMSSSPALGSVLRAQSLEPVSDSVSMQEPLSTPYVKGVSDITATLLMTHSDASLGQRTHPPHPGAVTLGCSKPHPVLCS